MCFFININFLILFLLLYGNNAVLSHIERTITADNGKEFAKHQEIAKNLEISFYFCKSYHFWERGANEKLMVSLDNTFLKERI